LEKLIGVGLMESGDRYRKITDVLFATFNLDPATRSPSVMSPHTVQGTMGDNQPPKH
jgi:hypothetical protein